MRSLPLFAWTHPESSIGLAAAENLSDAAGLKPETLDLSLWSRYSEASATAILPLESVGLVEIRA